MTDAPFLWLTFISWAAARRTGAINEGATYEAWEAEVQECQVLDLEDDGEAGRPFRQEAEPG